MRTVILCLVCFTFVGCSPWFSGGGSYHYKRFDPTTNAVIEVAIESTREVGTAKIHFNADGSAVVEIEGLKPGSNNMTQALSIIGDLVNTGAAAVTPIL